MPDFWDEFDPRNDAESGDFFQNFYRWYRSKKEGVVLVLKKSGEKITEVILTIRRRF